MISILISKFKKPKGKKKIGIHTVIFYAILGVAVGFGFNTIKPFFSYAQTEVSKAKTNIESSMCEKVKASECNK